MANVIVVNGGFSAGFSGGFDVYRVDQTDFNRLETSTVIHNNLVSTNVVINHEKLQTLSVIEGETSSTSINFVVGKLNTYTVHKDNEVDGQTSQSTTKINTLSDIGNVTVSSSVVNNFTKITTITEFGDNAVSFGSRHNVTKLNSVTDFGNNSASTQVVVASSKILTIIDISPVTISGSVTLQANKVSLNTNIRNVNVSTSTNIIGNIDTSTNIRPVSISASSTVSSNKVITLTSISGDTATTSYSISIPKLNSLSDIRLVNVEADQEQINDKIDTVTEFGTVSIVGTSLVNVNKVLSTSDIGITQVYSSANINTNIIDSSIDIGNVIVSASSVISQNKINTISIIDNDYSIVDHVQPVNTIDTSSSVSDVIVTASANTSSVIIDTISEIGNVNIIGDAIVDNVKLVNVSTVFDVYVETSVIVYSDLITSSTLIFNNEAIGGYSVVVDTNTIGSNAIVKPVEIIEGSSNFILAAKIATNTQIGPRIHASVGIAASTITYIRPVIVEVSDGVDIIQNKISTITTVTEDPTIISHNTISVKKIYSEFYAFRNYVDIAEVETFDLPWLNCGVAEENPYFSVWSDCKESERNFFDRTSTELINLHGVDCTYYHSDYNTENNKLMGEDNDYMYVRKFPIKAMFELPVDQRRATLAGLEVDDKVEVKITIDHFKAASTFDYVSQEYYINDSIAPKQSDLIKFDYNGVYYEVLSAKKSFDNFLQGTHVWRLMITPYVQNKQSVSTDIKQDEIRRIVSSQDIFDTTDLINSIKGEYIEEKPPQKTDSIFGKWS